VRGSIKKALLGGAAVAMVATFVPTASAATADTFKGPGCFFNSDANQTVDPQGNQDGVIGVAAVAVDASNAPDPAATIECWIATPTAADKVASTDLVGTNTNGVITGQKQISYSDGANHDQNVYLCESDNGATAVCTLATGIQIPPQAVLDAFVTVNNAISAVLCPVTKTLAGSYAGGLITIDSSGNVFLPDPLGLGFNPVVGPCPGALPV